MLRMLKNGIRGCWFFFWGHIFAFFLYDKKYLTGRWFTGKMHGLCTTGWEWVVHDACARIFLHKNKGVRFPASSQIHVVCAENICFHPDDLNNFQSFGSYYQAIGKITLGRGTYIAPNVGIITANHSIENLEEHDGAKDIVLEEKCWVGMNAVILPGVHLGPHTIVGAGSVVTKSFPEGNCVIAGNPAEKKRELRSGADTV